MRSGLTWGQLVMQVESIIQDNIIHAQTQLMTEQEETYMKGLDSGPGLHYWYQYCEKRVIQNSNINNEDLNELINMMYHLDEYPNFSFSIITLLKPILIYQYGENICDKITAFSSRIHPKQDPDHVNSPSLEIFSVIFLLNQYDLLFDHAKEPSKIFDCIYISGNHFDYNLLFRYVLMPNNWMTKDIVTRFARSDLFDTNLFSEIVSALLPPISQDALKAKKDYIMSVADFTKEHLYQLKNINCQFAGKSPTLFAHSVSMPAIGINDINLESIESIKLN